MMFADSTFKVLRLLNAESLYINFVDTVKPVYNGHSKKTKIGL